MKSATVRLTLPVLLVLALAVPATLASPGSDSEVRLRSGAIRPDRTAEIRPEADPAGTERWVVRFNRTTGQVDRDRLADAGARIETPLPGQAFLVTVPRGSRAAVPLIDGVEWTTPYLPQDKIAPEIASPNAEPGEDVIVLLHLFADADADAVAAGLTATGLRVAGVGSGERFDRIVLRMTPEELEDHTASLAADPDVFWIGRRHRRTLNNDDGVWVAQSGMNGGKTTPVHDQGLYGEGQIAAVLDTGLDADMCFFADTVLGLPPTNTGGGTTVDDNQRKVIAVDFLWDLEDPSDPTDWDTHGHGTHVAGILAGDDYATPGVRDPIDGHAPAAKLVIQDGGYQADDCGDLPGIGCPVTDLIPIFQQAYDQGARTHSNSWNDNENAEITNVYTDAAEDVDEFMWNNPDFLIVFACGNQALGGVGTIGSPATAKNVLSTGGTYNGESAEYLSDISTWGPTDDGRIKPDVVHPSASIHSAGDDGDVTTNNCGERTMTGTSMAAPGVAGNSLLVREYFEKGFYPSGVETPADGFTAGAALVKAMIVNSGVEITGDAEGRPITIPSNEQGWGRILMDNVLYFAGDAGKLLVDDHTEGFTGPADAPVIQMFEVTDPSVPLKVTLNWNDYPSTPAASTHLVNDLDLVVSGPSGTFHGNHWLHGRSRDHGEPDRLNNLEQVMVVDPVPGLYVVEVSAHAVPSGPQPWALVITGGGVTWSDPSPFPAYEDHVVDDSGPNGNGDGVLDPGETATISIDVKNAGTADATSVIGRLYSRYPDTLKVYDNTASYPDMAPGATGSSLADHYSVTLEPSASCGEVYAATLGMSGDGFETTTGFSVDVGLRYADLPSTDTPLDIDRRTPAETNSYVSVGSSFPVIEVDATVNIDHSDTQWLEVLLYPAVITEPPVYLHNQTPGTTGIHTTYDDLTEPDGPGSLDAFVGLDPQGSWRLKVKHLEGGKQAGTLENWTLHLKSDIPFNCHPVSCGEGVPSPVGDTLMVNKSGASDVQISWSGVGASDYNVWRATDSQMLSAEHAGATGGATSFIDAGAQTAPESFYYVVRSVNSCRWESP